MKFILNRILKRIGIKKSMPIAIPSFNCATSFANIQVGKLTDEEMRKFDLGPYSKKSTPVSVSL